VAPAAHAHSDDTLRSHNSLRVVLLPDCTTRLYLCQRDTSQCRQQEKPSSKVTVTESARAQRRQSERKRARRRPTPAE
jgi:hypothetical protein